MAEEAEDVTIQTTDSVVVDSAVETTTETTSSEVEQTADTEVATDNTETTETSGAAVEEQETDSQTAAETEELKPKSQNRFQQLANDNRHLREQIKELEDLQIPTQDDYIEQGMDETQAKLSVLEAKQQQRDAIDSVVYLNQSVDNDLANVMREFPVLDPSSKQFNEKLATSVMSQYDRDSGAEYDKTGIMIRTAQLPYQYIKDKMDLVSMASAQAKVEAQKNVESMVSQADTPSSTAPVPTDSATESIDQMRERLGGLKF